MHEIEFKPSRRLGLLLAAMAMLALLAIYLATLPGALQLALAAAALGLGMRAWRRASAPAPLRIVADGRLQYLDGTGEWREAEVLGDSLVSTGLIVLRYRVEGQPVRCITLLPDSADRDALRRLRVSLRWTRRTRSDTTSPGAG